ncbi:MAG: hypothetical protein DME57_00710 [Verrucomicrobia bacterium]|nr:MAG: hypothetical protein DME57_00710 [Verrucomicrobiota bacterium]
MRSNAKSTAVNVIVRAKKRSDIAAINAAAALTARSLKPLTRNAANGKVNVIRLDEKRSDIAVRRFLNAGAVTTMRSGI